VYFWWWPNFGKRPSGDAEKLSSVPVWRTWKGEILALLGHNGAGKSGAEAASLRKSVGRVQVKSLQSIFGKLSPNWKGSEAWSSQILLEFLVRQTELRSTTVSMLTGVLPPTEASERSAWTCWCGRTNPKVSDGTSHFESQSMHVFRQLQIRCSLVSANLSIKVATCWQQRHRLCQGRVIIHGYDVGSLSTSAASFFSSGLCWHIPL
jgi:energy-coupling factor transporter ATP-binding protein EcfA2